MLIRVQMIMQAPQNRGGTQEQEGLTLRRATLHMWSSLQNMRGNALPLGPPPPGPQQKPQGRSTRSNATSRTYP